MIKEVFSNILGTSRPSWSKKLETDDSGQVVQKDIVHMLSPNQP